MNTKYADCVHIYTCVIIFQVPSKVRRRCPPRRSPVSPSFLSQGRLYFQHIIPATTAATRRLGDPSDGQPWGADAARPLSQCCANSDRRFAEGPGSLVVVLLKTVWSDSVSLVKVALGVLAFSKILVVAYQRRESEGFRLRRLEIRTLVY